MMYRNIFLFLSSSDPLSEVYKGLKIRKIDGLKWNNPRHTVNFYGSNVSLHPGDSSFFKAPREEDLIANCLSVSHVSVVIFATS